MPFTTWIEKNPDLKAQTKDCPECHGDGTVDCPACYGGICDGPCDTCEGKGVIECQTCFGEGEIETAPETYQQQRARDEILLRFWNTQPIPA